MKEQFTNTEKWSENVILIDAEYIDNVAFNLIVNFERMLGRRIPQADIAHWLDCIALDGGLREGENNIQVFFIHDKKKKQFDNFTPSNITEELNNKAFKDNIGEFVLSSLTREDIIDRQTFFLDVAYTICEQADVKKVMIIPNAEDEFTWNELRNILHKLKDDEKRISLFSMQPMQGGNFRQEILGYSITSASGIKGSEFSE